MEDDVSIQKLLFSPGQPATDVRAGLAPKQPPANEQRDKITTMARGNTLTVGVLAASGTASSTTGSSGTTNELSKIPTEAEGASKTKKIAAAAAVTTEIPESDRKPAAVPMQKQQKKMQMRGKRTNPSFRRLSSQNSTATADGASATSGVARSCSEGGGISNKKLLGMASCGKGAPARFSSFEGLGESALFGTPKNVTMKTKRLPKSKSKKSGKISTPSAEARATSSSTTGKRGRPPGSTSKNKAPVSASVSIGPTVRDLNESRLVNPLTEWPSKPQYIHHHPGSSVAVAVGGGGGGTSNTSSSGPAEAAAVQNNSARKNRGTDSTTTTTATTTTTIDHVSELLPLMDLYYPAHPDTFSIAYQARLLGFDIKPTATNHNPVPLPKHLTFVRDAADQSYKIIPPLGRFAQQVWKNPARTLGGSYQNSEICLPLDDAAVLDPYEVDPLYLELIHASPGISFTSLSNPQHQRLMAAFHRARPAMQEVIASARSHLPKREHEPTRLISTDWTVCTWSEYETRYPATKTGYPPQFLALCILPRPLPPPPEKPEDNAEAENTGPEEAQEHEIPSVRPMVIVWYTFGSYPYQAPNGQTQSGLVMHLLDISIPSQQSLFHGSGQGRNFSEQVVVILALSVAMEHAREARVKYVIAEKTPLHLKSMFETYFRMVNTTPPTQHLAAGESLQSQSQQVAQKYRMVADLQKCSTELAMLHLGKVHKTGTSNWTVLPVTTSTRSGLVSLNQPPEVALPLRAIVRFPNENVARAMTREDPSERFNRPSTRKTSCTFASACHSMRRTTVVVAVKLPPDDKSQAMPEFFRIDHTHRTEPEKIKVPKVFAEPPTLDVLRTFSIKPDETQYDLMEAEVDDKEIVNLLKKHQRELEALERSIEPKARRLLQCVVDERLEFERSDPWAKAEEERKVHEMFLKIQADRKALDMEKQKQLELDMDAVCCICNDGEVTPDNQILFCDTCDVPVHQMCYGVEQVPAGDYHCMACCALGRNKGGRQKYLDKSKRIAAPLPLVCELCPHKRGALVRTDTKTKNPNGKWVHAVCAKWQGLDFVRKNHPDLVEDVTQIKASFRAHGIKCDLCLGERGCFNKCAVESCQRWFHVTCARSVGNCQVIHGEDCNGVVPDEPWTLRCPEHSAPVKRAEKPKNLMTIEELIELAKSVPPEDQLPEPEPEKVPFNKATREEQIKLLKDPVYEKALIHELTANRVIGVRCEVCDIPCENAKDFVRCSQCRETVCKECSFDLVTSSNTADSTNSNSVKCVACKTQNKASGNNSSSAATRPRCSACSCPRGPLRPCFAYPVNPGKWRKNKATKEAFERSLFSTAKWIHFLCGVWNPKVFWSPEHHGKLDLVNVIMSHGRGFINDSHPCFVCGRKSGLKVRCSHFNCCWKNGEKEVPSFFHVTCARIAGLEVSQDDGGNTEDYSDGHWFLKCYRHCSNDFNFRAKLEDLYEVEKVRLEKKQKKDDLRLTFHEGSKLMNAAIVVVRILGWAWRWAEWWVDYNSSWEPLLDEGETEEGMTKEQLKIVDSTRESRCKDARKCRLVAFGAALRNRLYDDGDDFDRVSLDKALRAVLNTKSLVGPLTKKEIDFHTEWLGRAYRSKSKLLFLGDDKIPVENGGFCLNMIDQSPKYDVDPSKVPGKGKLDAKGVFESAVDDVDDFEITVPMKIDSQSEPVEVKSASLNIKRDAAGRFIPDPKSDRPAKRDVERDADAGETPKRRGRPPSTQRGEQPPQPASSDSKAVPRRRGRPPKKTTDVTTSQQSANPTPHARTRIDASSAGDTDRAISSRTSSDSAPVMPKASLAVQKRVLPVKFAASQPESLAAGKHDMPSSKRRLTAETDEEGDAKTNTDEENEKTTVHPSADDSLPQAARSNKKRRSHRESDGCDMSAEFDWSEMKYANKLNANLDVAQKESKTMISTFEGSKKRFKIGTTKPIRTIAADTASGIHQNVAGLSVGMVTASAVGKETGDDRACGKRLAFLNDKGSAYQDSKKKKAPNPVGGHTSFGDAETTLEGSEKDKMTNKSEKLARTSLHKAATAPGEEVDDQSSDSEATCDEIEASEAKHASLPTRVCTRLLKKLTDQDDDDENVDAGFGFGDVSDNELTDGDVAEMELLLNSRNTSSARNDPGVKVMRSLREPVTGTTRASTTQTRKSKKRKAAFLEKGSETASSTAAAKGQAIQTRETGSAKDDEEHSRLRRMGQRNRSEFSSSTSDGHDAQEASLDEGAKTASPLIQKMETGDANDDKEHSHLRRTRQSTRDRNTLNSSATPGEQQDTRESGVRRSSRQRTQVKHFPGLVPDTGEEEISASTSPPEDDKKPPAKVSGQQERPRCGAASSGSGTGGELGQPLTALFQSPSSHLQREKDCDWESEEM